jgi:hypothetical protein
VVERCVTALSLTACDSTFPCTVVAQELLLTAAARNCDGCTLSSDNHTLTVEHIHNVPRVLDNCGTVVSKHVLTIADTKKQRRTFPRPDKEIWISLEHEHDIMRPILLDETSAA